MARASFWFTLGLLVPFLFLIAAAGPAHSAEIKSMEQVSPYWVCDKTRYGRKCKWYSRYDEPLGYERDPLCRYIPWRCSKR